MDEMIARFFMPLADGIWSKYKRTLNHLEENNAKAEAIVACFLKFDNYKPELGNSYSYFTQVVCRLYFHDNKNESKYCARFLKESQLSLEDDR